jgi:hypothetical protein
MSRNRLSWFVFALLLVLPGPLLSWADPTTIPTSPAKAQSYQWITFLSQGPINWFGKDENALVHGRAYRVVITTSEIYNDIYIETVTLGREGCCKKLKSVRKFDLNAFCKAFNFIGEQAGFEFVKWVSRTWFLFRYHQREFVMSDIGKNPVCVAPYPGG